MALLLRMGLLRGRCSFWRPPAAAWARPRGCALGGVRGLQVTGRWWGLTEHRGHRESRRTGGEGRSGCSEGTSDCAVQRSVVSALLGTDLGNTVEIMELFGWEGTLKLISF